VNWRRIQKPPPQSEAMISKICICLGLMLMLNFVVVGCGQQTNTANDTKAIDDGLKNSPPLDPSMSTFGGKSKK
jgi:hypothetical protein